MPPVSSVPTGITPDPCGLVDPCVPAGSVVSADLTASVSDAGVSVSDLEA